jgi:hypothetical protein
MSRFVGRGVIATGAGPVLPGRSHALHIADSVPFAVAAEARISTGTPLMADGVASARRG